MTTPAAGDDRAPASADSRSASVDRLAAAVPVAVIVLYTTVLGVLASSLTTGSGSYLPLRWALYAGCLLAIVVSVPLTYRLHVVRRDSRRLRFPTAETVTALWAFAVWGLVIPESPLYVLLGPPTLPVVVGSLAAVGVYVLTGILGPLLDKPARPRRSGGLKDEAKDETKGRTSSGRTGGVTRPAGVHASGPGTGRAPTAVDDSSAEEQVVADSIVEGTDGAWQHPQQPADKAQPRKPAAHEGTG